MKRSRLFARIVSIVLSAALLAGSAVLLFACNKDKPITINDIFKADTSEKEFGSSKLEFTLPVGWSVYETAGENRLNTNPSVDAEKPEKNTDTGYIKDLDGFVIQNTKGVLSIIKCNDSRVYFEGAPMPGMILPERLGIKALRVKDGLIACKFNTGNFGVFDYNGKTVLSRTHLKEVSYSNTKSIDEIMKILDGSLVAVHYGYEMYGVSGYTSIFRTSGSGDVNQRGELISRVANADNALKHVRGFDGKFVTVVGNKAGDGIFFIPSSANGAPKNVSATSNGSVVDNGNDDYFSEITYIGKGRFFIHEDWTVAKDKEYTYFDGEDYYVFSRHIYTPENDKLSIYSENSDKVFLKLSNNYYDAEKAGVDTSSYLNDGFTYASYGLSIEGKGAFYDQYILDENLNVVMSLTGNYGITIKGQKKDKVSVYDLIMSRVDGYYYTPISPSEVNIYDTDGNLVGHNDRSKVIRQELSNNVMVAAVQDPNDSNKELYGAFDISGKEIIPFEYTSLSAFRGAYSIGVKVVDSIKSTVIVGVDGVVVETMSDGSKPLADMAKDKSGNAIYKIGCYMFTEQKDGVNYFGVKNFNPNAAKNTVMSARMLAGATLYAPNSSPSDVFVFEQVKVGSNVQFSIYRLI